MDLPSKQSSQRNVRSSSSVRLAATSTRSHRTVLRGRDETAASLQASGLRSLRRTVRYGDASLVGQQVLQEDVQKRLPPRKSPHPVRLGYPPFFRLRGWRPTGLDRSLGRRQVNQLVERMVVAEVNSAEPGVLASERSRFHRNGLVGKRKNPSRARPSDPSQQVRAEVVARSPGWVEGWSFNKMVIARTSLAARIIGRANSKHRHRCGQTNSSHDCRAMSHQLSHHCGDGFERVRSFAAS